MLIRHVSEVLRHHTPFQCAQPATSESTFKLSGQEGQCRTLSVHMCVWGVPACVYFPVMICGQNKSKTQQQ